MIERRTLITASIFGSAAAGLGVASQLQAKLDGDLSWANVERMYPRGDLINFNNGGLSPVSSRTAAAAEERRRHVNLAPALNLVDFAAARSEVKRRLAALINCSSDEIALNRNGSEGLCTAIYGLPFERGDEIVLSRWDYASMRRAWRERASRDGLVLKYAEFELPSDADTMVEAYARVIGPRTRAVYVTHMPEHNGELFPAERICALAQDAGAVSIVDAAHTVAHLPVDCAAIGCDLLSTSLHKWLSGPTGTGLLYIKSAWQDRLRPLIASYPDPQKPIDRFDQALGTYDLAAEAALLEASDLFTAIGAERYQARLHERKTQLVDAIKDVNGLRVFSPVEASRSGAIVTVGIDGLSGSDIRNEMLASSNVLTRSQNFRTINGVRMSPHIYTRDDEIIAAANAFRRAVDVLSARQ